MENRIRTVITFRNYFNDFLNEQSIKVKKKILRTLDLIEHIPVVPEKFLKHIEGTKGLFEIRVQFGNDIFRIFCFFDQGRLVVLMNGFQKKSNKAPKSEIDRALQIMKEYENEKKERHDA